MMKRPKIKSQGRPQVKPQGDVPLHQSTLRRALPRFPDGEICEWCKSRELGALPFRLGDQRSHWHIKCFELARQAAKIPNPWLD